MATGLTLRGHPLGIKPVIDRCWLTVTHLPYGLPEQAIKDFFADFGEVKSLRFVQFRKVFTGTVKVQMVLHRSVPTRIRILGHAGLVYHPGQSRTCFHCGVVGHESKRCPTKQPAPTVTRKKSRSKSTTAPKPPGLEPATHVAPSEPQSGSSPDDPPAVVIQDPPLDTNAPQNLSTDPAVATLTSPLVKDIPVPDEDATTLPTSPPSSPITEKPLDTDPHLSKDEGVTTLEVSLSPKGSFGPPTSDHVDVHVDSDTVTPRKEEQPAFKVRFTDPPPVQHPMNTNRKASRRRKPAPIPSGTGLACIRTATTPAPVSTGTKEKIDTRTDPSDPPSTVSSLSDTGLRTST